MAGKSSSHKSNPKLPPRPSDVPLALWIAIVRASAKYLMPPQILAAVWRGESGSTYPNPYVNSEGYGGLFGTKLWNGSTQAQADYAASIFHNALVQTGGDIWAANGIYATGKPNPGIYGHAGLPKGVLPGYSSLKTVRVKIDGVWYKVRGGKFIGKQPPPIHGASFLGELGHYTIHPLQGVQVTAGAAGGLLDKGLMKVLYGVAIFGGFLLVVTGFAMIGLDLTLGRSTTARKALEVTGVGALATRGARKRASLAAGEKQERSRRREERAEEKHKQDILTQKARRRVLTAQGKHINAKVRTGTAQRQAEKSAYISGRIDEMTPNLRLGKD